ncbi:DUF167 family protein [Mesorhizobium sp. CAU 1741]|uniref:DUF167 family protein n=1 Tax=Mesorhizobium sp. CAU 1741 TaxID=3140366 RepID=UPI00325ADEDE
MSQPSFHRRHAGGVEIVVRLTPNSARDLIEGTGSSADGRAHVKARVRAVPEKGKANQALVRLVARALDVPASNVRIVSGDTARLKTLRVSGDADAIEQRLAGLGETG